MSDSARSRSSRNVVFSVYSTARNADLPEVDTSQIQHENFALRARAANHHGLISGLFLLTQE
jgi:hypothetical protein